MSELNYTVTPARALDGCLRVPGDKSMSHRAIMLGALAEGVTEVEGFLDGADCLATLAAFRAMGVDIERPDDTRLVIHGVGLHGLRKPGAALDMGNSGTAMRLLTGLLAGQDFDSTLTGDESLHSRPMRRVTEPLARMGARIDTAEGGTAPLRIHGGRTLTGIDYPLPVASAQIKSCLLLAGLYAQGRTRVSEPAPTRDHTERMLEGFGYPVTREPESASVSVEGGAGALRACHLTVPGDISSAAFFLVGGCIASAGELILEGVGVNPTRTGVIDILRLMGARIEVGSQRLAGGEPVADIRVAASRDRLRGVEIPEALVPLAIDEFPALFVAAACARGPTVLSGAGELRVKETDRIQVMAEGLWALGLDPEQAAPTPDGIVIQGRGDGDDPAAPVFGAGEVHSRGDHRIAMAFAMASLAAGGPVRVRDCANVATSFPGFVGLARGAGLGISEG